MANARNEPDESSIKAFVNALEGHGKVDVAKRRPQSYLLDLEMSGGNTMTVFVTNIYVVGEADVRLILAQHPDANCVVTLSSWNMVSSDAARYGREREVGVFKWGEFFGAINYRKYWLYESVPVGLSAAQAASERRRRRVAWN